MDYLVIFIRTIFYYFFINLTFRIMGKREIGELSVFDLVIFLMMAELVVISIESFDKPLINVIIPIITLTILQITSAKISLFSNTMRRMFDGDPSLIIVKGKINVKEMKKQRYNLDDLLMQTRQKDIRSLNEIEYAVLETDGTLSVFTYNDDSEGYPMPIIMDGVIQIPNLKYAKISKPWVEEKIKNRKVALDDIFYAYFYSNDLVIVKRTDLL